MGAALSSNTDIQTFINNTVNEVTTNKTKEVLTQANITSNIPQTITISGLTACGNIDVGPITQTSNTIATITSAVTDTNINQIISDIKNELKSSLEQKAKASSSGVAQAAASINTAILTTYNNNETVINDIVKETYNEIYNQTNNSSQNIIISSLNANCSVNGGNITIREINQDSIFTAVANLATTRISNKLVALATENSAAVTRVQSADASTTLFGIIGAVVFVVFLICGGLIWYFTKKDSKGLDQYSQQLDEIRHMQAAGYLQVT